MIFNNLKLKNKIKIDCDWDGLGLRQNNMKDFIQSSKLQFLLTSQQDIFDLNLKVINCLLQTVYYFCLPRHTSLLAYC